MNERACICGAAKSPAYAFCAVCYWTLSRELRRALWQFRPGSYVAAVRWLRNYGRLNPEQLRVALEQEGAAA